MELRTDFASPATLRCTQDVDRAVIGNDRPIDQIDGANRGAFKIALAFGERGDRREAVAGAREGRGPVKILFGIDRDPESGTLTGVQFDQVRCGRIRKEIARRLHHAPLCPEDRRMGLLALLGFQLDFGL